ncbi:MAG: amidase [Chloroflexi bacterium]|nr:MAG: amidase [Phototrophicales bacterium]RMF82393.1 MAG: amidase [Chloroflexota bacterium]
MTELIYTSATQLARMIRRKEVSSREVVQAHLDRIEAVNPKLNAVVQRTAHEALEAADAADKAIANHEKLGPLHGVPMTIKDSLDTAGVISTGGTTGRATFVPKKDATVVKRLREAGAILIGKTNTPELTIYIETDNLIYGRTNNPYHLERTPGGSSGGAAAIVAAGGSPFDIGSDYGGSVRFPAALCGLAGIKPTSGRVPRTGHIIDYVAGAVEYFQTLGPIARNVEDLKLILPLICGPDDYDPFIVPVMYRNPANVDLRYLHVAFYTDNGIVPATPETVAVIRKAADALSKQVASIIESRPTGIEQTLELHRDLTRGDGGAWVRRLLDKYGTTEYFQSLHRIVTAEPKSVADFNALIEQWDAYRSSMWRWFKDYDVLLCPVNAYPATPHGTAKEHYTGLTYTMSYNLTGWPGATVRGGTDPDGLPIGVQIVAHPWREDIALAVAEYLESELGGFVAPEL